MPSRSVTEKASSATAARRLSAAADCSALRSGPAKPGSGSGGGGAGGIITGSSAPDSRRPWTTPALTPAAPARPERDHANPSSTSASTRARAPVIRSGFRPLARTPGIGRSGRSAPGARNTMRSTMPRVVSV